MVLSVTLPKPRMTGNRRQEDAWRGAPAMKVLIWGWKWIILDQLGAVIIPPEGGIQGPRVGEDDLRYSSGAAGGCFA